MTDASEHSRLERIVDSKGATFVARIVTPALVTAVLGMGFYIGNGVKAEISDLKTEVKALSQQIAGVVNEQGRIDERQKYQGFAIESLGQRIERIEQKAR